MANNDEQHVTPPSPEVIRFLREKGLDEQANLLEKQFGMNSFAIEVFLDRFITVDPECIALKKKVRALSVVEDAVLIQGETGTGKELLARALGAGRTGKFVAINCAGMPRELIESELFGHVTGAFTDAKKTKAGLIEVANEGTLFLDEIGDLPLDMQAKLLRVIQEKAIRKVGGEDEKEIDVRFIAATHLNLKERVEKNEFRKDLYARLSTFELCIKPLRERIIDIPLIISKLDTKKTFPVNGTDWSKFKLDLNVRSIQQMVRQWQVLGVKPEPDFFVEVKP